MQEQAAQAARSCLEYAGMIGVMIKKMRKLINMPLKIYLWKQCKCLIFLMIYSLASLSFPGFLSYIVDDGIMVHDANKMIFYCVAMSVTGIVMIVFQYMEQISFYKLAQEITAALKEKIYHILTKKNINFWSKHTPGDMFTVLEGDVERLENLMTATVSDIVVNLFMSVGIAAYFLWIDVWIGMEVLTLAVAFACIQRKLGDKVEKMMDELRGKICELSGFTDESMNHMLNIQASGYSTYMEKNYSEKNRKVIQGFIKQMKCIAVMRGIGGTFHVAAILSVLIIGSVRVREGTLSIGLLFSLTIYVQRLYAPIVSLGNAYMEIRNCWPIIRKILSVLENGDNITSGTFVPDTGRVQGKIEFRDISFCYPGSRPVFQRFHLSILPGTIIGIVGDNGSGKSTLTRLLTKLCIPVKGKIFLDDVNLEDYNTEFLRTQIGYMLQNQFFFKGQLKEIVDPYSKTDKRELIRLMDFFRIPAELFEDGLDTEINGNLISLSGGEAQKIAMVRLFCENKPVYILDEPTAALDMQSEEEIIELLRKFLKNKTAVIITHRKKILDICDRVVQI